MHRLCVATAEQGKDELEKYITGIVQNNGHKLIAIGTMPDHIHIFIGYNVNQTIPKLVEQIKTSSNHWIKNNHLSRYKFSWQTGYGAFTHSHQQIDTVAKYVLNQEEHHRKNLLRKNTWNYLRLMKLIIRMNIFSLSLKMWMYGINITVLCTW
jgi:REP element-mobilizing transposase RayT